MKVFELKSFALCLKSELAARLTIGSGLSFELENFPRQFRHQGFTGGE